MLAIGDDFWPASLAHLTQPYLSASSQYVTLGEISGELANGFPGSRLLYTAMVPVAEADECLERLGGIGHGISSGTGHAGYYPAANKPPAAFWINSRRPDHKRYQPLVESWRVHDRHILQPFSGLLEYHGLSPEILPGNTKHGPTVMVWHDLSLPTYNVVRVTPLSVYEAPNQTSTARVEILREYLEDYLLENECVALATQWEGRYSTDDPIFESAVGQTEGLNIELKGRELWLKRAEHIAEGNQWSDTWCTRLVMKPEKALDANQTLEWPDHDGPIAGSGMMGGFEVMEEAYVRDEVLIAYEDRPEFDIHPETGMVGHGTWWSVSYCHRVGRDHIALELRKLYEGAQFSVIKHYCQYAVRKDSIPSPQNEEQKRNIGIRGREFIEAYLAMTNQISIVCDAAELPYTAEDLGGLSPTEIEHKGWWNFATLGRLGNVAPINMTYPDFLARCKYLFAVFEGLKAAHLRALLMKLRIPKSDVKDAEGIKLCAYLCQFAKIAEDEGWGLVSDAELVIAKWDKDTKFDFYRPFFALNVLRTIDAHGSPAVGDPVAQTTNLEVFGIHPNHFKTAGGLALDRVYDVLITSMHTVTALLKSTQL